MKITNDILLVGAGNMGFAMAQGWLEQAVIAAGNFFVVEPNDDLRARMATLGATAFATAGELPEEFAPSIIVIAVKPQVMGDVLPAYARFAKHSLFISVAAGVRLASLQRALGAACAIARVMPNTPAAIGQGVMAIAPNEHVTQAQLTACKTLMAASGTVVHLPTEDMMDAVTAVSGSGPAYVFLLIETLRDAGIAAGLPDDIAATLALQTVVGAANYAGQSGTDPALLRQQVTSPNGTTAAALDVLMNSDLGMGTLLMRAVEAGRDRSVELS